jgi:5-amino-6-(5-phosphoribosylamino)uracil reductase
LILSNAEDLDRLDEMRAQSDAVLVGAETVRRDNPSLLIRSEARKRPRQQDGRPEQPIKVTLTRTGWLEASAAFFTRGGAAKVVYAAGSVAAALRERLGSLAEVVACDTDDVALPFVLEDLHRRSVARLLLEGGGTLATQFHAQGLVDELHLSIAPFFVGDPAAPRFVQPARFAYDKTSPLRLVNVEKLGEVALLMYRSQ